jgi:uncharacterized protein (TIGR01244 family)
MLRPICLTDCVSVSAQIFPGDVRQLAAMGFKSIINNRPDGEEGGQPTNSEIQQVANEQGVNYFYLPVISGNITQTQCRAFAQLLRDAPKPILAFCRTGTRCSVLWSMSRELG